MCDKLPDLVPTEGDGDGFTQPNVEICACLQLSCFSFRRYILKKSYQKCLIEGFFLFTLMLDFFTTLIYSQISYTYFCDYNCYQRNRIASLQTKVWNGKYAICICRLLFQQLCKRADKLSDPFSLLDISPKVFCWKEKQGWGERVNSNSNSFMTCGDFLCLLSLFQKYFDSMKYLQFHLYALCKSLAKHFQVEQDGYICKVVSNVLYCQIIAIILNVKDFLKNCFEKFFIFCTIQYLH